MKKKLLTGFKIGFLLTLCGLLSSEMPLSGAEEKDEVKIKTKVAPVFSWQERQAKVLPSGGLEWAPRSFVFEKGASVRYIDFKDGDDLKDGRTKETAWKHHPWDANAEDRSKACKGHSNLCI